MENYQKLKNQPLKFVLAEFRFSPVMDIATYIPKIQESLRRQYPIPERRNEQVVKVQNNDINLSTIERWSFVAADKRSAIDINQESLVYITSDYPRFDGFSEACKKALDILISIVEPSLILRVGLRYSDLITVEGDEKITNLINEHFISPKCIDSVGTVQQQSTNAFLKTDTGILVIRTLYGNNNLTCLPDVQGLPVHITTDVAASERIILDIDHSWEARDESVSFEANDVLEKLGTLHVTSRETFWKVTTDYARNEKWA